MGQLVKAEHQGWLFRKKDVNCTSPDKAQYDMIEGKATHNFMRGLNSTRHTISIRWARVIHIMKEQNPNAPKVQGHESDEDKAKACTDHHFQGYPEELIPIAMSTARPDGD